MSCLFSGRVVLVGLCCWLAAGPSAALVKVEDAQRHFASPNCKTLVCEQAHEQAKGLSKLAILDEFVSQTVFLLKDLMKNIDGELERTASSLLRYIHPNCEATRDILQEVIEQKKGKQISSPEMGEGVDPFEEEEQQTPSNYYPEVGSSSEGDDEGDYLDSRGGRHHTTSRRPTNGHTGGGFFTTEQNTHTTGSHGGRKTPRVDKFGRGWDSGQETPKGEWDTSGAWKGSHTWGHQEKEEGEYDGSNQKWGHQEKQEEGGYGYKKKVSTSRGNGKAIKHGRQDVESGSKREDKTRCRGVEKGSAFWVNGLDQWCVDNCSKGYCPKTHCVC